MLAEHARLYLVAKGKPLPAALPGLRAQKPAPASPPEPTAPVEVATLS